MINIKLETLKYLLLKKFIAEIFSLPLNTNFYITNNLSWQEHMSE